LRGGERAAQATAPFCGGVLRSMASQSRRKALISCTLTECRKRVSSSVAQIVASMASRSRAPKTSANSGLVRIISARAARSRSVIAHPGRNQPFPVLLHVRRQRHLQLFTLPGDILVLEHDLRLPVGLCGLHVGLKLGEFLVRSGLGLLLFGL